MLQEEFLEKLKIGKVPVSIFLVSGIQLVGTIEDYDVYTIALSSDSDVQLVFKQQITTIQESNGGNVEKRRSNRLFKR